MKIGIVVAMEKELLPLVKLLGEYKKESIYMNDVYTFTESPDVIAVKSGIGEIQAATAALLLIERYGAERILNYGFVGSYDESLNVGDIVNITGVFHCDMDLQCAGKPAGMYDEFDFTEFKIDSDFISGFKTMKLSSSDRFLEDGPERDEIIKTFGKNVADMEGAGIAVICHKAGIPCSFLKCVSNTVTQSFDDYYQFSINGIKECAKEIFKLAKGK